MKYFKISFFSVWKSVHRPIFCFPPMLLHTSHVLWKVSQLCLYTTAYHATRSSPPVLHPHRHWLFQSLCMLFCVTANENLKFSSGHALPYLLSSALYCFSDLHECPINQPGSNHINWNRNLRKNYFLYSVGFLYCILQGKENPAIPSFLPIQLNT